MALVSTLKGGLKMKRKTAKFPLLMAITLIAPLLLLACATTTSPPRTLQGQYVGAGTSTCLFAVCGFGDNNVPGVPAGPNGGWGTGAWSLTTQSHSQVMTFEPDGTGTTSEDIRAIVLNGTSPTIPWPSTGENKATHKFTYTVAPDGTLTYQDVPGTFKGEAVSGANKGMTFVMKNFSNIGHVSPDGNVITLFDTGVVHTFVPAMYFCPVPMEPRPEAGQVCHASFILYKQH